VGVSTVWIITDRWVQDYQDLSLLISAKFSIGSPRHSVVFVDSQVDQHYIATTDGKVVRVTPKKRILRHIAIYTRATLRLSSVSSHHVPEDSKVEDSRHQLDMAQTIEVDPGHEAWTLCIGSRTLVDHY
jgi:hypothetical protein